MARQPDFAAIATEWIADSMLEASGVSVDEVAALLQRVAEETEVQAELRIYRRMRHQLATDSLPEWLRFAWIMVDAHRDKCAREIRRLRALCRSTARHRVADQCAKIADDVLAACVTGDEREIATTIRNVILFRYGVR